MSKKRSKFTPPQGGNLFYRTTSFIWQHTPCLEHFSSPPPKKHTSMNRRLLSFQRKKTSFHNEPKNNENMTHQKKTRCKLAWWWGKTNQYKIPLLLFGDSGGTSVIGRNFFCEKIERAKCSKKKQLFDNSPLFKKDLCNLQPSPKQSAPHPWGFLLLA